MASTAASGLTARARDSSAAESNNNGLSPYEQARLDKIARNESKLASLGLLNSNGTAASTALLAPSNNSASANGGRKSKRQAKKNGAAADASNGTTLRRGKPRKSKPSLGFAANYPGADNEDPDEAEVWVKDAEDAESDAEGGSFGGGPKKAGNGSNSRRGRGPKKAGNGGKTVVAVKGPKTRSKAANPKGERIQSGKSGLRTFSKDGHAAMKASGRNSVSSGGGLHEHNRRNGKVLWERLQDLLNDLSDCRNGKMFGRMKGAAGKKGNFWCKGEDWNDFAALLKVLGNGGNKPGSVLRLKLTHDTQSTWGATGPPFREPKEQKKMMPHSKAFKKATLVFCRTTNVSPSLM